MTVSLNTVCTYHFLNRLPMCQTSSIQNHTAGGHRPCSLQAAHFCGARLVLAVLCSFSSGWSVTMHPTWTCIGHRTLFHTDTGTQGGDGQRDTGQLDADRGEDSRLQIEYKDVCPRTVLVTFPNQSIHQLQRAQPQPQASLDSYYATGLFSLSDIQFTI